MANSLAPRGVRVSADWRTSDVSPCAEPDAPYRPWLTLSARLSAPPARAAVVMLNPSAAGIADGQGRATLDPTVRQVWRHLAGETHGDRRISEVTILNAYDLRATDPQDMLAGRAVVNDRLIGEGLPARSPVWQTSLIEQLSTADVVILGWGAAKVDASEILRLLPSGLPVCSWGQTQDGHPRHPCYLAARDALSPWPGGEPAYRELDPPLTRKERLALSALYMGADRGLFGAPVPPSLRAKGLIDSDRLNLNGEILAARWGLWA